MGYCETIHLIGGKGGDDFNIGGSYHENGSVVNRIEVWAGASCLNGIKINMSDGQVSVKGKKDGRSKSLDIPGGVTVRELSLWGNGVETRCGGIYIKLSDGSELTHSMERSLKQEYVIEVGSGIPVAVRGKSGWEIDCLGFVFLKPIESCETKNVEIDTSGAGAVSRSPVMIKKSYPNHTSVPQQAKLRVSESFSITRSCTGATGLEISAHAKISFGPPECQIGGGVSTTASVTLSRTRSETSTRTITDSMSITVPENRTVEVSFQFMKATIDAPYKAKVYTTFKDGTTMVTNTQGTYLGTSVVQGTSSYKFV